MTVSELIEMLKRAPQDAIVLAEKGGAAERVITEECLDGNKYVYITKSTGFFIGSLSDVYRGGSK